LRELPPDSRFPVRLDSLLFFRSVPDRRNSGAAIIFGAIRELFDISISEQVVATGALAILTRLTVGRSCWKQRCQAALMLRNCWQSRFLIGGGGRDTVKTSAEGVELPTDSGGFGGMADHERCFFICGWQTASFSVAKRNPRRDLPSGVTYRVIVVIVCMFC